jgi:mannose-6-phosphate isomerase-like protein (cupin superfamily)
MSQATASCTTPADRGQCRAIDLKSKIDQIDGYWQQRVIAEMNDYQFKVARLDGDFVWHKHSDTDETFIVLEGELHIDFRGAPSGDGIIVLHAGQMAVVPKGVEHRPRAQTEVKLLLIEPGGVLNTGDGAATERTVELDQWV